MNRLKGEVNNLTQDSPAEQRSGDRFWLEVREIEAMLQYANSKTW